MEPEFRDTARSLEYLFRRGKEIEKLSKRVKKYQEEAFSSFLIGAPAGALALSAASERHPLSIGAGIFSVLFLGRGAVNWWRARQTKKELKEVLKTKEVLRRLSREEDKWHLARLLLQERKQQRFDHSAFEKLRKWWRRFRA